LTFHVLAIINSGEWSNTQQALVAGTKIASKQAAGLVFDDEKNEDNLEKLIELKIKSKTNENQEILLEIEDNKYFKLNASHPVIEFSRSSIDFFLTPVLVCKNPKKTVGLGDSISSVGLVFSHYNEK
jgi:ADP-dependent glucokinase